MAVDAGADDDFEALRGVYDQWARGNFWTPDIFHPDVEVVWDATIPDANKDVGIAGFTRSAREWLNA
jgi:hypothetical protein